MASLANGTYYISSNIFGGQKFYLGFGSGATQEDLVINSLTGSRSQQWYIEPSSLANFYTFKNRQHQTYITANPPGQFGSNVLSGSDPRSWFVTGADWGYAVGIDRTASLVWNVNGGENIATEGTNIILWSFDSSEAARNEFWKFEPIQEQSATPSPTTSSSELPSSTTASTSSATSSSSAKEGMDLGDKIGLAVGLGVGIPTLIVAIVALFVSMKKPPTPAYSKI